MWMAGYKRPWEEHFSEQSTQNIINLLKKPEKTWDYIGLTQISQAMQTMAAYAAPHPPLVLLEAIVKKPIENPFLINQLNQMIDLLEFRKHLNEEFSK